MILKSACIFLLSKTKKIFYFRDLKNCIKSINIFVFLKIRIQFNFFKKIILTVLQPDESQSENK